MQYNDTLGASAQALSACDVQCSLDRMRRCSLNHNVA
jgi:hypothetical protein